MQKSDSIKELATALAKAQAEIENASKNAVLIPSSTGNSFNCTRRIPPRNQRIAPGRIEKYKKSKVDHKMLIF